MKKKIATSVEDLLASEKLAQLQELYSTYSPKRLIELRECISTKNASMADRNEFQKLLSFERIRTYSNYVKSMNYQIDWQWFHHVVIAKIDEMIAAPISKRVMFELPPRHCKTLLAGQLLSTYLFGRFLNKSIVYATAVNPKAVEEATAMRNIITSARYQELFPGAKVKTSLENTDHLDKRTRKNKRDTATVLSNLFSERGGIRTVGMGDILTGHPFHFGIADDLYKGFAEAQSDKIRESIWNWFIKVFCSRADKGTVNAVAHIIMFFTRWHEDDVCGRLQRIQNENRNEIEEFESYGGVWYDWEVLSFEAIKTDTKIAHISDKRAVGEPLWKLYESEYYQSKVFDPMGFEALYQQNPVNKYGRLFERSFFQEYETLPNDIRNIVISIDPNLKDGKSSVTGVSDNFAILVFGLSRDNIYLLDFLGKSKDYNTLKLETQNFLRKFPHHWQIVIEQTASGPALTSDLKHSGFYRITEFSPGSKSKYEKASLIIPELMAGKYFVPSRRNRPDIEHYINQHLNFSGQKGKKDDFVDATVIGILYYMQHRSLSDINYVKTIPNPRMNSILPKRQNLLGVPKNRGFLR